MFIAWPKRELHNLSSFPATGGESEVCYVFLEQHFLVPVPTIMCFTISIPLKSKTDVAVMEG